MLQKIDYSNSVLHNVDNENTMWEVNMTVRLTVKEWRKAKGISIESAAKDLGMSPVTYAKYEENPSLFPVGKAQMFCSMVGADLDSVIFLP